VRVPEQTPLEGTVGLELGDVDVREVVDEVERVVVGTGVGVRLDVELDEVAVPGRHWK
jgi:hypothetical protein